jgi:hypothetical protein
MDASSIVAGGAASMSPSSPVSSRHGIAPKRKRSTGMTGLDSSPGSLADDDHAENEKKRQPGVKRACNECRQQKVSHHARRASCLQFPFSFPLPLSRSLFCHLNPVPRCPESLVSPICVQ